MNARTPAFGALLFSFKVLARCANSFASIRPGNYKLAFYGHLPDLPDDDSADAVPCSVFTTRHGFETLLRRLVIGSNRYPNIEQIVGTVTGVIHSPDDPTTLREVSVRTSDGDITLPAALVIGSCAHSGVGVNLADASTALQIVRALQRRV